MNCPARRRTERPESVVLNRARGRSALAAVLALAASPNGFTVTGFAEQVRVMTGQSPRGTYRRLTAIVLATIAAASAVFVVGTVVRTDFDRPPTVGDLLLALPTRYVPPAYLTEIDPMFLPTRPVATLLYEWPGVLVLLVLAVGLALSFRRNRADTFTGD